MKTKRTTTTFYTANTTRKNQAFVSKTLDTNTFARSVLFAILELPSFESSQLDAGTEAKFKQTSVLLLQLPKT
jgi:hypothetical protein